MEASEGVVTGVAEGKGCDIDGETAADTLVSGDGGGRQKKKERRGGVRIRRARRRGVGDQFKVGWR